MQCSVLCTLTVAVTMGKAPLIHRPGGCLARRVLTGRPVYHVSGWSHCKPSHGEGVVVVVGLQDLHLHWYGLELGSGPSIPQLTTTRCGGLGPGR